MQPRSDTSRTRRKATDALYRLDRSVGRLIEDGQRNHHLRRLEGLGWSHVFEAHGDGWATGEPPIRSGNHVEILIDGGEILPRMVEALRRATSHISIAGWHATPDFVLDRDRSLTLRRLLEEAGRRVPVRVLLWAGVPLRLPTPFFPSRRSMGELQREFSAIDGVRCALDAKERALHCHHEKLVIADDVAFVGGMDFTTLGGDRNDSSYHPPRRGLGWHDAAALLRGPVVGDVADHFATRWEEVTGERLAPPASPIPAGDVDAQIVRTVPEKVYSSVRRGDFRILEAYLGALASAQKLVYLESQFLWSAEVVAVLSDKLRDPPADAFRVVAVLPSKPESGADDTWGELGVLIEADDGAGRLLACCLFAHDDLRSRSVYVHAKIGIVDDRWLTIGSANLNSHSLYNDTEVNVVSQDPGLAAGTRHRLWAEHLEADVEEVRGDPTRVVDEMLRPTAFAQLERMERGLPPTRRLVALRGVSRRSKRLVGPLQSLVVDA